MILPALPSPGSLKPKSDPDFSKKDVTPRLTEKKHMLNYCSLDETAVADAIAAEAAQKNREISGGALTASNDAVNLPALESRQASAGRKRFKKIIAEGD